MDASPFFRSIVSDTYAAHTKLRVRSDPAAADHVEIQKIKRVDSRQIGDNALPGSSAARRLSELLARKQGGYLGESEFETIFCDDRSLAIARIRAILENAHQRVVFVDPYFGAKQLVDFALWVKSLDAEVLVLAGAPFLKGQREGGSVVDKPLWPGFALDRCLRQLQATKLPSIPVVSVMRNHKGEAIFHDRLLLVDDQAA
jgi:hypothetical protein